MKFQISPTSALQGEIQVAGDKSISHRSVILGAIANGATTVRDILEGEDVLATIGAFRKMGVSITRESPEPADRNYVIEGVGLYGLEKPGEALDMGNSGTAFRLLGGLLAAQPWTSVLTGDEYLCNRPMDRIITPLKMMGAQIDSNEGKPPLTINPAGRLHAIEYTPPMASAQVKSAILLAGLYADGQTTVIENSRTRDHTERMLQGFGFPIRSAGNKVILCGGGQLQGRAVSVPADLSSAAFFILAGLITADSELLLKKTGINPSRNGVLKILTRMGGQIELENPRKINGEPVADIRVKSSDLKGVEINGDDIALSIDEIPVIAVAAACAGNGSKTRISNAEELRVKESDRIHSVVRGLSALGIEVIEHLDGMTITGGKFQGGEVNSFGDHRIAMAFAIAGTVAKDPVVVSDCENVATSFPDFCQIAQQTGVNIAIH